MAIDTHVIRILAAFQRDIDIVFREDWVHYVTSLYLGVVELLYDASCFGHDPISIEEVLGKGQGYGYNQKVLPKTLLL